MSKPRTSFSLGALGWNYSVIGDDGKWIAGGGCCATLAEAKRLARRAVKAALAMGDRAAPAAPTETTPAVGRDPREESK